MVMVIVVCSRSYLLTGRVRGNQEKARDIYLGTQRNGWTRASAVWLSLAINRVGWMFVRISRWRSRENFFSSWVGLGD